MADNPWTQFEDPEYVIENKGRPAVFLIPSHDFHRDLRENLQAFLRKEFGGYQRPDSLVSGEYTTTNDTVVLDKCVQYEVSFLGKERIARLVRFLANMARLMDEECIYFKAGEDTCLIRPRRVE